MGKMEHVTVALGSQGKLDSRVRQGTGRGRGRLGKVRVSCLVRQTGFFLSRRYATRSSRAVKSTEREPTAKKTAHTLRNKAKEHVSVHICVYLCCVSLHQKQKRHALQITGESSNFFKIRHKPLMRFWHLKNGARQIAFQKQTKNSSMKWTQGKQDRFFSLSQVIASWCLLNIHGTLCSKEVLNKYYYLSFLFFFFLKAGRKEEKIGKRGRRRRREVKERKWNLPEDSTCQDMEEICVFK